MTTDFSYGDKTINSLGPIKPSGTNQPLDPRTEVKIYADIETIPNPYVGMIITVLEDETNQNKMTDYKVLSLKPNSLGIANSVIDQVQKYSAYLGVSTSSGTGGTGLTSEQEERLNKIPEIETSINNINESLNTKANTSDIPTNTSELYNDSGFLTSIPSEYVTETEMNEAIANVSSGGNVDLSGYATKDDLNTKANTSDIPTNTSELYNDSGFLTSIPSEYVTETEMNEAIANVSSGGSVSQEDINTAVNNYLTEHPVSGGATEEQAAQIQANKTAINKLTPLNFIDSNVTKAITANVNENIVKQEYLGGYIEIQPDSWDGTNCDTDDSTRTWGFPYSLLASEQARIKKEIFPGNGKGIMYIRFPLGFAYRGYRNIDETSRLAKNIGQRWKGQNASLKLWFEDIAKAGGGLAPEYWCPAPHWVTGGAYHNSTVDNRICAGGSYDRTRTLASIKTSDSVQYNAQIEAFTDAIVDDLEYLHQNIAPVRMFGLQNEPSYAKQKYGACGYDKQTYNDILQILVPKIKASAILSEYNDEPNEVKILVASSDESYPFSGIASTYIANNNSDIWGYTHHLMRKASGEVEYETGKRGADWYKTSNYSSTVKGDRTNVFCNEYEYFNGGFTGDTDDFRCSNNMLHLINELVYGEAKVLHPVIHVCKPIGQSASTTNTKGYSMYAVNLKNEYGVDITNSTNTKKLLKGTYYTNSTMYNAWKMFNDNLPINSYVVGDYTNSVENGGYVTLKHGGKLYIFLANNGSEDIKISLTFNKEKYFKGKFYDKLHVGDKILDKSGSKIDFIIPAYSGQCWIEEEEPIISYVPISCEAISLSKSSLTLNTKQSQTLTATLTPSNTTDPVYWSIDKPSIASIVNGVITPISDGTATVTVTCGTKSVTCAITVSLPTLQSISAVYNQGSTVIYPDSSLNDLKSGLTVTGIYTDNSTEIITDYKLSGTLTEGTSTITVTYNSLITTFDVTVTQQSVLQSITATYTQGTQKVYKDTALAELKKNLVVKANYSDGNQLEITDYELSGTLTEGTSQITVTYNEKATTFDVTVINKPVITNTLTTDSLISNIQAEDGCIVKEGAAVKIVDKVDNSKFTSTTLALNMYDSANKVISFASTNNVAINKKPTVGTDFTLETMIKTDTLIKTSTKFVIINFDARTNKDGVGFICRSGNILEASYRTAASRNETTPIQHTLDTSTTWTHMVAVVDISNMKLSFYVNGELVDTKDISTVYTSSKPISINISNNSSFISDYDINMIRLYDKALSKEEVVSNYNYQLTLV